MSNDPMSNNPYAATTPGGYAPPVRSGTPVMAIISLVCGILGVIGSCCCGVFGLPLPIVALVVGYLSMSKGETGRGMAIAGMVLGAIGLLIGLVMLILVFANPDLARQLQEMQQMQQAQPQP